MRYNVYNFLKIKRMLSHARGSLHTVWNLHSTYILYAFHRTIEAAANLWGWFTKALGTEVYNTLGLKRTTKTRIVEMFHGCTEKAIQEATLMKLKDDNDPLRIVISTVAFGMGVNIRDIRHVNYSLFSTQCILSNLQVKQSLQIS